MPIIQILVPIRWHYSGSALMSLYISINCVFWTVRLISARFPRPSWCRFNMQRLTVLVSSSKILDWPHWVPTVVALATKTSTTVLPSTSKLRMATFKASFLPSCSRTVLRPEAPTSSTGPLVWVALTALSTFESLLATMGQIYLGI